MPLPASKAIASFDSASAMLRALARFLHGKDFPGLDIYPTFLEPVAKLINKVWRPLGEEIYSWSGWAEAVPPEDLSDISAESISKWVVGMYPRRSYQAVAIGSSSGALVHLCAALGIPWLPQTFLIPVRRSGIVPGDMEGDQQWGRRPGQLLLQANPELQLHHMHDANQDRLMIQRMTYFRVKRLRLGESYERFLDECLAPGGTILVSDCQLRWPTVQVADRHIFQPGAFGGATPEEYLHGSPRVEEYLARYHAPRESWAAPRPDGESPEAEWGFESTLLQDLERLARHRGYHLRRLIFADPQQLSPLVADLYRWWYRQRGLKSNRMLVESFILLEPWWTLRTGAVPFWMVFNTTSSAELLGQYLDAVDPYDEIHMMLFSHGVDSIGLVPIERWRSLLGRARKHGDFLGVDEKAYPRDFATFIRYHTEIERKIAARYPLPGPLTLSQLETFLTEAGHYHGVDWVEHLAGEESVLVRS